MGLRSLVFTTGENVIETPVQVVEIEGPDNGSWLVPKDVTARDSATSKPFVLRLANLRVEKLRVEVAAETNSCAELRSNVLKQGDFLVVEPGTLKEGQAVAPIGGIDDERLIRLTLEAGMAAAMAEDLWESLRFISVNYSDSLGFNFNLMQRFLKRAYKEFDEPRVNLAEPPVVQIEGNQATVRAQVRLTASYREHLNYLLGDGDKPNNISVMLHKSTNGWKVSQIEGLRPLGFEEGLLKLLGAQVGLPLTEAERVEKEQACMPCRQRMSELFR